MTAFSVPSSPEQLAAMSDRAREVVRLNIEALEALERSLDSSIARAADIILSRPGYVVVTGMGKSGHIGGKIAATLASTGTNSFFVHPAEMSHGDLGMLRPDTTLLALSNSGESRELRDPLIFCARNDIPVIGVTQRPQSFLGRHSAVCLTMPKVAEACPNGLAPTTSTLMSLAMGDALAMVLMDRRGFTREDFGLHHPGGALGMSLQTVREWMGDNAAAPASVPLDADFAAVVSAITEGRKGAVAVLAADGALTGIITDGDLRRALTRDVSAVRAEDIMSRSPITVDPEARMSDVVDLLSANKISNLFVLEDRRPVAIIHIAELMQAGYVS
ncbi:KpsF/GutQ family sugar-phosphate isomerase [Brevundimonas diminuta]|jgi:arabinose-5-phosphate isomerase|uniref:KpsF/GutQ family sugar-phosphate isomerase n=1 Tax=Brevundimonas diminuta TaxID=293 RepID=UPI000ED45E78|nr:KpsF/GutQ family sugar-phosphate isomerase [Brevundimonas diminuta]HCQ53997.1 KpsF/GutQ family sugar-phosphate isomerase [Brevundimonas diminuta]